MKPALATRLSRRGVAFATAALLLSTATAHAQTRTLSVSVGGGPPFPARTLLLTAPGSGLTAERVHVLENGGPVGGLVVRPLSQAHRGDYGVVLLIDTSGSMAGAPIAQAMATARTLAAGLSAGQEISVIEFDQTAHVVVPLTTDTRAIDRALAVTPRAAGGTHIFDAAALAERELLRARVAAGAVIVMSDGSDVGSRLSAEAAAALGRPERYDIYTVGVRDRYFAPGVLTELARDGAGTYVAADPSQLRRTVTALQAKLTSRYVLHYRSLAGLGQHVRVSVSVSGVDGAASLSYTAPALPLHRLPAPSFWASNAALIAGSLASALLLVLAFVSLIAPRLRPESVQARIARFTDGAPPAIVAAPGVPRHRGVIDRIEDTLRDNPRWQRFSEELEIAGIGLTPLRLLLRTALATGAAATILGLATGIPLLMLPVLAIGPLVLRATVRGRLRKRRRIFADNLAGHLQEIASAMRAGHSIVSALGVTADGAAEPGRSEFQRVIADEQLGKPLHVALAPMAQRMACPDITQLALIASVHDRSGGNMAEVLDRLASSVRERNELQRELRALTAQARLSRYIVTALPPGVLGVLAVLNPGYVSPLFHTTTGLVLLAVAAGLVTGAYFVMAKIVEIEV